MNSCNPSSPKYFLVNGTLTNETQFFASLFTISAIAERVQKTTVYRSQIECDLDSVIAETPEEIREETWNYATIMDDMVMERELHISKNQLSTHFDLALLILDEGSESHLEYTDLLKRMRYDHLIIDAIENSSQGKGEVA